jgi:hypothetical protein
VLHYEKISSSLLKFEIRAAKWVRSDSGRAVQKQLYSEVVEMLEAIEPGVTSSVETRVKQEKRRP